MQLNMFGEEEPERSLWSSEVLVVGPSSRRACGRCRQTAPHIRLARGNHQCGACGWTS